MPSEDLASPAPPAHPAGEPGGPPGAGRVVPADRDRGPASRHNTLARSPAGDRTPETAGRCPQNAGTERRAFAEEAATQNGCPRTTPPGSATMPRATLRSAAASSGNAVPGSRARTAN
jgi:hypothetical protein